MAKYAVTGGAGFIGSNIVDELLRRGGEVKVIDNLSTGRKENLAHALDSIEFVEADILKIDLAAELKGCDYVLHQAALPSVEYSFSNPAESNHANMTGTLRALTAARDAGAKRFVLASSFAVYGDEPGLPKREDMKLNPLSPYGVAKQACEHLCRIFTKSFGLETVCLRYSNVYGPRQDLDSEYSAVIPKFAKLMLSGKAPIIYGDGEQTRDFVHASDVARANVLACESDKTMGEIINIGSGEATSVNGLAEKLNNILKTDLKPEHAEERSGEIKHSSADVSKAAELLGYVPEVGLEEGLKNTVEFFK